MFGAGMPILFPISAAAMAVMYLVEKALIYYSYRQPPVYDSELNDSVLGILSYAPLLFYSFGYWMLSNKQIFSNDIVWRNSMSEKEITNHLWDQTLLNIDVTLGETYCLPLFCCFWFFLITTTFRDKILSIVCDIFPNFEIANFDVDEDLEPFFETLDQKARDWYIKEEENSRSVLKFSVMDDENFEKIKAAEKSEEMTLQGVFSYDVLANPLYLHEFQYFSAAIDNREDFIIDDDSDEGNDFV